MQHLTEVILRLRAECSFFEERVAGTAAFRAASQPNVQIKLPHAFVIPFTEDGSSKNASGTAQQILERFAVVVALDNTYNPQHGAGMSTQQGLTLARLQLFRALVGWETVPWADTIQFRRGIHLDMNQHRLWHQYDWSFSYYMDTDREPEETEPAYVAAQLKQLYIRYGSDTPIDYLHLIDESPADRRDGPIEHDPNAVPEGFPGPYFHGITEDRSSS